jgi:hypothetical protein
MMKIYNITKNYIICYHISYYMPSKEQKKLDRREQSELKRIAELQKIAIEKEWEKGTDKRGLQRKEDKENKLADKIRRKKERQELLDEEVSGKNPY